MVDGAAVLDLATRPTPLPPSSLAAQAADGPPSPLSRGGMKVQSATGKVRTGCGEIEAAVASVRCGQATVGRVLISGGWAGAGQQPRHLQTLGEALSIRFMFERQTAQMLFERIFRIDLSQLLPHAAGFLDLTKMAESRRQQRTGEIRVGGEPDALA